MRIVHVAGGETLLQADRRFHEILLAFVGLVRMALKGNWAKIDFEEPTGKISQLANGI
jgi:hypothetical protein